MAEKHLQRKPHCLDDRIWWYEENDGIDLWINLSEKEWSSNFINKKILWRTLRAALKRKDKKG